MENIKMTEWKTVKIGDLGKIITGKTPSTKVTSYWGNDVPFVTPRDIQISRYIYMTEKLLSTDGMFSVRSSVLPKNAVCVSCIGNIGYVSLTLKECVSNQQINSIVVSDENDACFVYYLTKSLWGYFKKYEGQSTALSILNKSQFSNIDVNIPPLEIQRKIAGILGALDDRIDVLRRENVVLEQMAQAVFQSWFVDFDIVRAKAAGTPESEVCEKYHISPELYALFPSTLTPDNLPLGWEKLPFSETMKIVSGGTPKTTEAAFWNGNIPWYSVVDAPASVYVLDTEKHITQQGLENSPCSLLKKDTVIISARGTVGKLAMVGKEMAMNQSCYGLEFDFPYYGYLTTKQMLVYLRQNVHGAVFDTITKDTFKTVETVGIPRALQENFTKLVSSFFEKIYKNTQQIRALSATRDALLPQLLGGKIDVENVPLPHSGE